MAFKTQEQIAAEAPERLSRQIAAAEADQAKREDMSKKRVVVSLVEAPRERFVGDQKVISFSGVEDGRTSPLSGVYFVPAHETRDGFARDDLDNRLRDLDSGDKLSMSGYWSKRKWKGQDGSERESWEFKAQNFAKGDVSMPDIKLQALERIGNARIDALPYDDETSKMRSQRPAASPLISYVAGNIVDDHAQVLVNTVNSQLSEFGNPVMGKGVALEFKNRFPSVLRPYADAIKSGELTPGRALLFDLPDGRKWAALSTKDHFRDPSKIEWVEKGLKELGQKVREAGLASVAITPPGCGNGGLNWKEVEPLVHQHLAGIRVSLYAKPSGAMEPAVEVASQRNEAAVSREAAPSVDSGKAKALAAFGGGQSRDAGKPASSRRGFSEDELIAMIPSLLSPRGGYDPYAGIGSRETPQDVCDDMTAGARVLEARGFTLRSGFAGGADTAFELGTTKEGQREIFAPWKGFGSNPNSKYEETRWNQIRRHEQMTGKKFVPAQARLLQGEMAVKAHKLAAPHHPKWADLKSQHQDLHARNMGQVLGPNLDVPARFEMAWTNDGKATGGTGQAIRVAEASGIPVLNMHNPRIRAAVLAELGLDPVRNLEKDMAVAAAEYARTKNRGRDEGASVDRHEAQAAKQREVAAPAKNDAPSRKDGEFDLSTPAVRSRAKDDVAAFCKVADPLGSLSNMYNKAPLIVDGVTWKSSEALYQALRFPDHPKLQEAIRNESNAYTAKVLAHENKALTRPDWNDVNHQAMAWVITLKRDQSAAFRADLESTEGRDIVELSVKDDHWGAKPKGDQLVGHDVLGYQLTQLREGARMDSPPEGSKLLGREIGQAVTQDRQSDVSADLPEPTLKASMYFKYGNDRREGFTSESTFDAILAGERTSTTRYKEWGPTERWEKLAPGSVVRFYEDKEMRGRSIDVVVLGTEKIKLKDLDEKGLDDWSKVEGWSVDHARASARKYSEGVQIRYALPDSPAGRAALGLEVAQGQEPVAQRGAAQESRPMTPEGQAWGSPPAARQAAMSAKEKTLSLFG